LGQQADVVPARLPLRLLMSFFSLFFSSNTPLVFFPRDLQIDWILASNTSSSRSQVVIQDVQVVDTIGEIRDGIQRYGSDHYPVVCRLSFLSPSDNEATTHAPRDRSRAGSGSHSAVISWLIPISLFVLVAGLVVRSLRWYFAISLLQDKIKSS
jgi:hypothetical protein